MENTTVVTSVSLQTDPEVVTPSHSTMNVGAIRSLGAAQIVIGLLTLSLGIAATIALNKSYWLTESGCGIWGGLWILVTGVIGVFSASYPNSARLNRTHMVFCIGSCMLAVVDGSMFVVGLGFFSNCIPNRSYHYYSRRRHRYSYQDTYCKDDTRAAIGIYGTLVALMTAEMFVALVTAICCCEATCLCCRRPASGGFIFEHQRQRLLSSSIDETDPITSDNSENTGDMEPDSYESTQEQVMM